ncbi:hypothetical protein GQE99_01500 [Maritimibacter sp. DP07]|uniref:HTH luxR-type domain-containing protein n=1 Tax=Maritimibacter harenae TaxID=2606218 RepID=A0A845M027_9RHOB|nr:LuxR C-terminal-related transcriptional regulator [Maritimibacter harenae]MZR11698.1 hypothetical protein [Maritimibacter harenae]
MASEIQAAEMSDLARSVAGALARIETVEYGRKLLEVASLACRFRTVCVFILPGNDIDRPILTLLETEGSEYVMRNNVQQALSTTGHAPDYRRMLDAAVSSGSDLRFLRTKLTPADPRWRMYQQQNFVERVTCLRYRDDGSYLVSFFRSGEDGPILDAEESRLEAVMPLLLELVMVRHKLPALTPHQAMPRRQRVLSLKRKGIPGFADLSEREAEVCDLIAAGLSSAAIAQETGLAFTTIRTFRQRAFRKLGISTAAQFFSLLLSGE